ncbi:hypothetical protein C8Q73DRAFT_709971 [Cubamyces lactineus]|nr:hypothetical protein C8Q73DRAFT_709971 [Cubamyces lactineus]
MNIKGTATSQVLSCSLVTLALVARQQPAYSLDLWRSNCPNCFLARCCTADGAHSYATCPVLNTAKHVPQR